LKRGYFSEKQFLTQGGVFMGDTYLNRFAKIPKRGRPVNVSAKMAETVCELVQEKLQTSHEPEALQRKLNQFKEQNSAPRFDQSLGKCVQIQKKLTYPSAYTLLRLCGFSLKDAFARIGITCTWPLPEAAEIDHMLLQLPDWKFKEVLTCIENLAPEFCRPESNDAKDILQTPYKRIIYTLNNKPNLDKDRTSLLKEILEADPPHAWNWVYIRPRLMFTDAQLIRASHILQVSPAWILGLDDGNSQLLASSPKNELILTRYFFLQEGYRVLFKHYLELSVRQEVDPVG